MADINLIPQEAKKSEEFEKLRAKITIASVAILILTAIAAFVTLAFFAFYISEREKLLARVEDASAAVNSYKSVEELLVVVKDKATTAEKIKSAVLSRVDVIKTLAQLMPQNVYFTDVKIASDATKLSGRAKSSADVAGLISAFLSQEGQRIISNVTIDSLASDETGTYTFSVSAKLTK